MSATAEQSGAAAIRPFHVDIPDEALEDLRRRIAATRLPGQGAGRRIARRGCSWRRSRSSSATGRPITTGAGARRG